MFNRFKQLIAMMSSLKFRIPAIITLLMLLNLAIVSVYFRYFFADFIAKQIEKFSGRSLPTKFVVQNTIFLKIMTFEVVVLALMIVIFGVLMYLFYSRPLTKLCVSVNQYKKQRIQRTIRPDEIGRLQNAFADMAAQLEEEKNVQNRMIASISHDIKTPLTSVLGYSESLMKKDVSKERLKQYLLVIYSGAKDIEEIIEEFDGYIEGRLQQGLKFKLVAVSFLEQMLVEEYADELKSSDISFTVSNACSQNASVSIDLARMRRVFANLIVNAVRHNADGVGLRIEIRLVYENGTMAAEVSDNGKGVTDVDFAHLFEPFYTTDKGRTVSGLGLSICRNIIEAHGGEITARSRNEGGLVFRFTLPAAEPPL